MMQHPRARLFLVSFAILFLELASIRWYAAHVIFLQYFTNVILLACFCGMSIGLLAADKARPWLNRLPWLLLVSLTGGFATYVTTTGFSLLSIDTTNGASATMILFGTEGGSTPGSLPTIPLELIIAIFFALLCLQFVGLGELLGEAFEELGERLDAYALNLAGSLAGVVFFSLLSLCPSISSPLLWFPSAFVLIWVCAGWGRAELLKFRTPIIGSAAILILTTIAINPSVLITWSPYYAIRFNKPQLAVEVNTSSHQVFVPVASQPDIYSAVHRLRSAIGRQSLDDVLVIGSGSGNDVSAALAVGARHVDAVEIDPVILNLAKEHHPDRPYQDPRVTSHVTDGREFLERGVKKYDLVIYALVDSLILQSGFSSVRLESFLFTNEAFHLAHQSLKPGGIFVVYNAFRYDWLIQRLEAMLTREFGGPPLIFTFPHRAALDVSGGLHNGTAVLAASESGIFSLDVPERELPPTTLSVPLPRLQTIPTDSWPFVYLEKPTIPVRPYLTGALVILTTGLLLMRGISGARVNSFNLPMFWLGAGFMLQQTKAVVQLSLLFGSTWVVNAAVFAVVLFLLLTGNLIARRWPTLSVRFLVVTLVILLLGNAVLPLAPFLSMPQPTGRFLASTATLLPILFSSALFSRLFREVEDTRAALGSNVAGSLVGGILEGLSLLFGFAVLNLVAVALYLAAVVTIRRRLN